MAKTPFVSLTTEDILSAHISGLATSINNLEGVLNMKTKSSEVPLVAVANQEELSLRYRIYEGNIRNWTAQTIKRNGVTVSTAEYSVQPAFGVVVFHAPQLETDEISASVTHVYEASTALETINTDVASLQSDVTGLTSDVVDIQSDIQSLQANSGGFTFPLKAGPTLFTNVIPGKTVADLITSSSILMAGGKIDATPIVVNQGVTISKLRVVLNTSSGNMIMGIYSDNNSAPGKLLGETAVFTASTGEKILDLVQSVSLTPGIYWVARWAASGIRVDGHKWNNAVHITFDPNISAEMDGTGDIVGVRSHVLSSLTNLPNPFPPIGTSTSKYLARTDIGTVYALS